VGRPRGLVDSTQHAVAVVLSDLATNSVEKKLPTCLCFEVFEIFWFFDIYFDGVFEPFILKNV
jgi:hypothetical protein